MRAALLSPSYTTTRDTTGPAITRLYQGRWSEATQLAAAVLAEPTCASVTRIMASVALGRVRARRGDPGAHSALDEALALASQTGALQRLEHVRAARAELAWLSGDTRTVAEEAHAILNLQLGFDTAGIQVNSDTGASWQVTRGTLPQWAARPFLHCRSRVGGSRLPRLWRELDCPYERARALADGDLDAQMEALRIFTELGAGPAAKIVARKIREGECGRIPRGPRASTRSKSRGADEATVGRAQLRLRKSEQQADCKSAQSVAEDGRSSYFSRSGKARRAKPPGCRQARHRAADRQRKIGNRQPDLGSHSRCAGRQLLSRLPSLPRWKHRSKERRRMPR